MAMGNEQKETNILLIYAPSLSKKLDEVFLSLSKLDDQDTKAFIEYHEQRIKQLVDAGHSKTVLKALDKMSALVAQYRQLCTNESLDFEAMEDAINKGKYQTGG